MSDFLQSMAALSEQRAANAGSFTASDFDKPVVALSLSEFDVIAEIKDTSPAAGVLATSSHNRGQRAQRYAAGGAAAISVLTEPSRFAGELSHLAEVVAAVPDTPVMRKDFLVDAVQILEARKAGASGVLLIATMLSDKTLHAMLDCAWEHSLFVLLESFDAEDLARSTALLDHSGHAEKADNGELLFGVNTRNLRTLAVDADRLRQLAPQLPQGRCVAESGLNTVDDAARVSAWGYSVALVGTALMRSDDPATLVSAMKQAGSTA